MVDLPPPAAEEKERTFMFNIKHRGLFMGMMQATKTVTALTEQVLASAEGTYEAQQPQHPAPVCRCTDGMCHGAVDQSWTIVSAHSSHVLLTEYRVTIWPDLPLQERAVSSYISELLFLQRQQSHSRAAQMGTSGRYLRGGTPLLWFVINKLS